MNNYIAIHHQKGSFSDEWIKYCQDNRIEYKIVNAYANDIVEQLSECDIFMWHWHHNDGKAILFAKQLLYSLEIGGMKVFPNSYTVWHFDDKVGQKYLLETIKAPFVKNFVFYSKKDALKWIENTSFPKVFKLRGGAGASNVSLIKSKKDAKRYIAKAFGKGFGVNRLNPLKEYIWKYKKDKNFNNLMNIFIKGLGRVVLPNKKLKALPIEKNYLYIQEFIPNNDHDIRIIVVGNRAFAIKRMVREDDFRASGSGVIIYDKEEIPIECVKIAFEVNKKIKSQCTAFDFIFDNNQPLIVEISYGFNQNVYRECPGYWDEKLEWYEGKFIAENFILEDMINNEA